MDTPVQRQGLAGAIVGGLRARPDDPRQPLGLRVAQADICEREEDPAVELDADIAG